MVYGIGKNCHGRLGIGDMSDIQQPKEVETLCGKNIKTFCCGGDIDQSGAKKISRYIYIPTKVTIGDEECIIDIACSVDHTIALTNDGKIYTWGNSRYENLVKGPPKALPWQLRREFKGEKIIYITCGRLFNMALCNIRNVYSWGINNYGQLGIGNCTNQALPCLIVSLTNDTIVKVVCGFAHTLAFTAEGKLYLWSKNSEGQLGYGKKREMEVYPIRLNVPEMRKVLDIAIQNYLNKSIVINENRRVYVWVSNMYDLLKYDLSYIIHCSLIDHTEELNILKCLGAAFDDKSTSDFTIQIKRQLIHLHKAILNIRCQYFRNMFQCNRMENNQTFIMNNKFSYITYKAFLKYLYTGMADLPSGKVLELLKLADKYSETNLKRIYSQVIKEIVTVSNELEKFCFQFAMDHLTDVVQTQKFATLNKNIILDFIIKAAKAKAFKN
ncbi:RCC1 and BTB domain-containing protein 1-like [Anoplolepis gracilipes]|uniref:RCC1 and BTB domain-containing protein 1-like n=1 Tax=Anoplolepis gracilipes TaxID=354296 RepID=UPI003BA0354E